MLQKHVVDVEFVITKEVEKKEKELSPIETGSLF